MIRALSPSVKDPALLVSRLVLGTVLIAHGWQKIATDGIAGTADFFVGVGVPLAPVAAVYSASVEFVGGILIVLGAATAVVGLLVVVDMLGAAAFVHVGSGVFVTDGGWELVGVIAAAALALAACGAGRISVDHVIAVRRVRGNRASATGAA